MVTTKQIFNPLEQIIGTHGRISGNLSLPINNFIDAERLELNYPDNKLPEEQGTLFLYPISDNQFCLQLCYLLMSDAAKGSVFIYSIRFLPEFFDQYPAESLMANQPFRFDETSELKFPICSLSNVLLSQLQTPVPATALIASLQQTNTAIQLLQRALACITMPFTVCQVPACRFLAYETEREKIKEACQIIEHDLGTAYTIRELSRKVAINECYLKKGFKALTGKTVHEYREDLRIKTAKELLQQKGLSVTEVANELGFSSISHFSTAFKRTTGLKPCELLS